MISTLQGKRYPGRFIALGMDGESAVVIYGATGRSPSSLSRKFVQSENAVYMTAVDDTVRREGNVALLEYPALRVYDSGVVVANGSQIDDITTLSTRDARQQLSYALSEIAYEPDEYNTPRITGCVVETPRGFDAALHIARLAIDGIDRSSWTVPMTHGVGSFISTYRGDDVKPTPSFRGAPLSVELVFGSAKNAAQAIFDSLAPLGTQQDYRVGVMALYKKLGQPVELAIVNRIV